MIFVDNTGMVPRKKPTNAELAILRVLWSRGPSTVRAVAEAMGRAGAYTTVLKLLQIMATKRLVRVNKTARSHVYEAARAEGDTKQQLVRDLMDRAFDGSAGALVVQALSTRKASPEELAEIRKLLAKQRKGDR